MIPRQSRLASIAIVVLLGARPALADDYIYKGDCERARLIQAERTIDKLVPFANYYGVQRADFKEDGCGRDNLIVHGLKQVRRSTAEVVYAIDRSDVVFGVEGECDDVEVWSSGVVTGTVTLTTGFREADRLCEVFISAEWDARSSLSSWTHRFNNRLTPINDHSFIIAQPASKDGKYWTPISFTGVP